VRPSARAFLAIGKNSLPAPVPEVTFDRLAKHFLGRTLFRRRRCLDFRKQGGRDSDVVLFGARFHLGFPRSCSKPKARAAESSVTLRACHAVGARLRATAFCAVSRAYFSSFSRAWLLNCRRWWPIGRPGAFFNESEQ
jgi:hypothetical protein